MGKKTHKTKNVVSAKSEDLNLLDNLDSFFEKHEKIFLWISLVSGAIISFLMFDCKVSLSGDDCDYVVNAQNFINHFAYPGGRGALYPIVISPFLIGGLNLILLKSLSAVFILLSMWFMYKAFRGAVPASVLMPVLLITNICPYIFFYASYTYSEPFFMLTQSLFIYLFSTYFCNREQTDSLPLKIDWKKFLFIGFCFLAMGLTRTIGYAVMGAIIVYFCFQKQWKNLICSLVASVFVFVLFSILKSAVWPESGAAYNINNYLAKNFYNIEQGMEDLPGFVNRLVVNSHIYLSGFLYKFMGFRSSSDLPFDNIPVLTVITYMLFTGCIIITFKRNRSLFFTGIYVGVMNFASFVLLQTIWVQDRLIMIYYPLMLLFILGGVYYLLKNKALKKLTGIYPLILIVLFIGTGLHLKDKVARNLPVLQQNISGNDLYGLTPDWENFIRMSQWANDHLDKNAVIASRKPSMSYIYTGREFFGLFNVPNDALENVIRQFEEGKDEYAFLIMDINRTKIQELSPYVQHILIAKTGGNFSINNEKADAAVIYKINKALLENGYLINGLDQNNVNYTLDHETFISQYINDKNNNYQIINPDLLLETIKGGNIKYLLLPKIRVYTPQNTGRYINTIHQYISFIQTKYPDSFKIIHSIGKEEICEIAEYTGP
jgi:hypothetical protein